MELGPLGARTAQAKSFAAVIGPAPVNDGPKTIPAMPASGKLVPQTPVPVPATLTDQQQALLGLSHLLETMTTTDPATTVARNRHVLSGPQSQIDVAMDRVEDFLGEAAAKAAPT